MNSRNRKHLVVLLFLLVCTGRTDAFFRTFKDWYDKLTPFNEECNEDWISFDGRGVGKGLWGGGREPGHLFQKVTEHFVVKKNLLIGTGLVVIGNRAGLKADLKSRLFGQHIAAEVIMKAVEGLMNNDNPKKPMVLSFHGTSGTGKSLASQLIVKNIYKKGMDSRFVHFFSAAIHFPDIYEVETYKSQLQHWIRGNVTNCARSMFIFDEMDKIITQMHAGVIDGINPFMDHQYKLDGVSYSKAIFIFLSNSGSTLIAQTTLDSLKAGKEREKLKLKDMENALSLSSPLLIYRGVSNVVDFFIPFLPLERRHIVQCIMVEMKAMGHEPQHEEACELADEIVNYFPKDEKFFSSPGCKRIASRLRFFM